MESDVASRTVEPIREAAGIVTVLTADDLRRAGCRDLLDALRLIPELEIGGEIWNSTGIGMRGNWGSEGKVLVLLDDHVFNELNYGSFTLGNRIPISLVDRIEVIRGPGSAVYGGLAALAVVKVTTRGNADYSQLRLDAQSSWLSSGVYGRQDLTLTAATRLGDDGHLGVSGAFGRGRRTDGTWTTVAGLEADLTDGSALDPGLVSAELELGGLSVAGMVERYHTTHGDGYAHRVPEPKDSNYNGAWARASWALPVGPDLTVTPRMSFVWQRPWESVRDVPLEHWSYSRQEVDRTLAGVDVDADPIEVLHLVFGAEGGVDRAHVPEFQPIIFFDNGRPDRAWALGSGWAQAGLDLPAARITAGLRLDAHELYGAAVSPRLGITRAGDHAHGKLLVSRAFRAPSVVLARSDIDPDTTTTVEAEAGVGPTDFLYLTATAFDVRVADPLVYFAGLDDEGLYVEGYINGEPTGTDGLTTNATLRHDRLSLSASWAVYTARWRSELDTYAVPRAPDSLLGLPNHKVVVQASAELGDVATVGFVGTVLGPRYAITGRGRDRFERLPTAALLDLVASVYDDERTGLTLTASVHDLLNAAPPFVQPYDGGHPPLPSGGRELLVQLTLQR